MRIRYFAVLALLATASLAQAQKKPGPKEIAAINGVFQAQDPATRIINAQEFIATFSDSEFVGRAWYVIVETYAQQRNWEKVIVTGEQCVAADPKSSMCFLHQARAYAETTREFDLNKEEQLKKLENLANQGIVLAKTDVKPNPNIPDADWELEKSYRQGYGTESLAIADVLRKNYEPAVEKLKKAIELGHDPTVAARLAQTYVTMKKYDDALTVLNQLSSNPDPNIASYAKDTIQRVTALKSGK